MKNILRIALAYVGVTVGAGFASGQEVLQYFIAFGPQALWGVLIAVLLFAVTGKMILELGSLWLASNHNEVLDQITHPWLSRILDAGFLFTCFSIGFVMIAGGGSNLHQQFGIDPWIGSVLMAVLIILAGMQDTERVTTIIGGITPFLIVFVVLTSIYGLTHIDISYEEATKFGYQLPSNLPNVWVSALNYVGLNLMACGSMAFIMGGEELKTKTAGRGGLLGGLLVSLLVACLALAILSQIQWISHVDMPMLALVNRIHPFLGVLMAFVILGMIFNTGLGMYYAMAQRLSKNRPDRFKPILVGSVVIGFVFSFGGFKSLLANIYPILGYIGIAFIAVVVLGWVQHKSFIDEEGPRRSRLMVLLRRRYHPDKDYTRKDHAQAKALATQSPADTKSLLEDMGDWAKERVKASLEEDTTTPPDPEG